MDLFALLSRDDIPDDAKAVIRAAVAAEPDESAAITAHAHAGVQSDAAVRENGGHLALALDGADLAYWDFDLQSSTMLYDTRCLEMLGYSPQDVEPGLLGWADLVHPDDRDRARETFDAHVRGATPSYECEYRVRTKSGGWLWLLSRGRVVVRDEDGRPLRAAGTHHDITGRRRSEDLLREEHRLAVALSGAGTLREALDHCITSAISVSGMDAGGVYLVDPATGDLELAHHVGLTEAFVRSTAHYATDTPNARLVREAQPVYVDCRDLGIPLEEDGSGKEPRALAVLPVLHRGRVVACLNVASYSLSEVPQTPRASLEAIANQIGRAIAEAQARESLREREENLAAFFDASPDLLLVADESGHVVRANQAATQWLGYAPEEIVGRSVPDLHPPDRREEAAQVLAEMLAGTRPTCEIPLLAANGGEVPVETRLATGTWDGRPAIFGVSRDARERKQAALALEKRDRLLQGLARMTHLLLTATDLSSTLEEALAVIGAAAEVDRAYLISIDTDPSNGNLLGRRVGEWSRGEVTACTDEVPPPDVRGDALPADLLTTLRDGGVYRAHAPELSPDSAAGPRGALTALRVPVFVGDELWGLMGFDACSERIDWLELETAMLETAADSVGVAMGRQRAMEALAESEAQYRAIIENMQDVYYRTDNEGRLILASPSILRLLGCDSLDEMLGRRMTEFWMQPGLRAEMLSALEAGGGRVISRELLLKRGDGTPVPVMVSSSYYRDSAGNVVGIEGVLTDITERKRVEDVTRAEHDLALRLSASRSLSEALGDCLDAAIGISGMDCGGVYVVDPLTGDLDLVHHTGLPAAIVERCSHFDRDSVNARLAAGSSPVYGRYETVAEIMRRDRQSDELQAMAVVPIHHRGRAMACLNLASRTLDEIPQSARASLEAIAGLIGQAIAEVQAREALAEREENLNAFFNSSPDLLLVVDPDGLIVNANPTVSELLGYDRSEVIGAEATVLYPQNRRAEAAAVLAAMHGGQRTSSQTPLLTREGTTIPAETRAATGRWNGRPALFLVSRDVSERERAQQALRESEEMFAATFRISPDPLALTDVGSGRILEANSAFAEWSGFPREELLGRTTPDLDFWLRAADRELVIGDLQAGRDVVDRELALRIRDGEVRTVLFSARFISVGGGRLLFTRAHDVTEARRAEQALRDSESFSRSLLESLRDPVLILAQDGSLQYANPAAAEHMGVQDVAEVLGRPIRHLIDPGSMQQAKEDLERVIRGGGPVTAVYALRPLTGELRWVESCAVRIAYKGSVAGLLTLRDITERKRAEEALRESEERFHKAFHSSPDAIIITRANDGVIVEVNEGFSKLSGYSREEAIGATTTDLDLWVTAEDRSAWIAELRSHGRVRDWSAQTRVRSGEVRDFVLSAEVTVLGGERHVLSTVRDVTDSKRRERATRESAARISRQNEILAGLSVSPNAAEGNVERVAADLTQSVATAFGVERLSVWLLDEDGDALRCIDLYEGSAARHSSGAVLVAAQFGDELEHLRAAKYVDAHDALTDPRSAGYVEGYLKPLGILSRLSGVIRSGGRELGIVCFEHVGQPHRWEPDEIAFVCQLADQMGMAIANRRRRQAEEGRLEMERRVQRAEKLESIGVLAGGIAHDFNNILAGMVGWTELALAGVDEDTAARLQRVLAGADRAKALVQHILAFCRQAPVEQTPGSLRAITWEALRFVRASLPSTVVIAEDIQEDELPVRADATQIHQVILNLCTNAEHAMRPAGGELGVRLRPEYLGHAAARRLGLPEPGLYARLTVSDTGCGMDATTRERVFDPFFTTKPVGEGTGLGLATSYGIITGHGGTISVESELGVGSRFDVYLPLDSAIPAPVVSEDRPAPRGVERVLFVDDEQSLADAATGMLAGLGYKPTVLCQSAEALERFLADPQAFDLVMTDQTMPDLTGLDLVARVRAVRADIPVILMTGHSPMVTPEVRRALGIAEVLMKPYTTRELAVSLRRALGGQ